MANDAKETDGLQLKTMPSLKRPKDKMNEIIGEIGKWQFHNIAIVFMVGLPGLAHIFSSVFVSHKSDFIM